MIPGAGPGMAYGGGPSGYGGGYGGLSGTSGTGFGFGGTPLGGDYGGSYYNTGVTPDWANYYWTDPTQSLLGAQAYNNALAQGLGTGGALAAAAQANMSNMLYGSPAPPAAPAQASTPSFTYPTPEEAYGSIWGTPHMAAQSNLLGYMESYPAYEAAIRPQMEQVIKALGRSGLPSSSYADRNIANTLGSLWNNWQWNVLTGWQDIGRQMPLMMQQWYSPYNTMMGMLTS